MNFNTVNRKVLDCLRELADDNEISMRKKSGHQIVVARFGGEERIFGLSASPGSNYQRNIRYSLNRFIRSLPIDREPIAGFWSLICYSVMVPAKYNVVVSDLSASDMKQYDGNLEVPDWYFDNGDELVLGEPDAADDVLMLLLNKLGVERSNVVYWNIAPVD